MNDSPKETKGHQKLATTCKYQTLLSGAALPDFGCNDWTSRYTEVFLLKSHDKPPMSVRCHGEASTFGLNASARSTTPIGHAGAPLKNARGFAIRYNEVTLPVTSVAMGDVSCVVSALSTTSRRLARWAPNVSRGSRTATSTP